MSSYRFQSTPAATVVESLELGQGSVLHESHNCVLGPDLCSTGLACIAEPIPPHT